MSMQNPITNYGNVTTAKVDYIEAQVQKNFEFRLESMKILSEQAMVTLNWLFALAITPTGYVFSKATEIPWWVAVPALFCSVTSGLTAAYLFTNSLKMKSIVPAGNEPRSLVSQAVMALELRKIRLEEICNLQERIQTVIDHNNKAGTAINNSRIAIIAIVAGSLLLLASCFALNSCWTH